MKLGLLEAGMARRLLGLPRGNQVELAAVARQASLGVKETEALVRLWRRAPSEQTQQFVLAHPREALDKAQSPPPREDPRLSPHGQWVQRRLRLALSAMTALDEALGSGLSMDDRTLLSEEIDTSSQLMGRMLCRLGPSDASGS
jgi:hypothetical protein